MHETSIVFCQSGFWAKQYKTATQESFNFRKNDFLGGCRVYQGNPWAHTYPCFRVNYSLNVPSGSEYQVIAQIGQTLAYGVTGGEEGHDAILNILINGIYCSGSRFVTSGANPITSATCTKKIGPGSYEVELSLTSSTNAFIRQNIDLLGSIVVLK